MLLVAVRLPGVLPVSRAVRLDQLVITRALYCLLLIACAPDVVESPHVSLLELRRAVEVGDTAKTLRYIDVDAIVARLTEDLLAAGRDSFNVPADDTVRTEVRLGLDSVEAQWRGVLRTQLGLSSAAVPNDTTQWDPEDIGDDDVPPDPSQDVLGAGVEIVGDGTVRYLGDTALVERILRYTHLDTSVTLMLALVPVGGAHWRVVAFHNALALAFALRTRQGTILDRANKPLRDSISTRAAIHDVRITREPLEEWDRYAVQVRAMVENRGREPLTLHSAHIVGPELSLADTVAEILSQPIVLAPGTTRVLAWRHRLGSPHVGLYDAVSRPALYRIQIADVEVGESSRSRIQLYRTWQDFIRQNPVPARSSGGVLAGSWARDRLEALLREAAMCPVFEPWQPGLMFPTA